VTVVADREYVEIRLQKLLARERAASERLSARMTSANEKYLATRAALDAERETINALRDEPVVIVRQGNPPTGTFHYIDRRCGWAPSDGQYMFESEGLARRLRPCKSCANGARRA
jgi:hypothetical protein